MNINEKVLRLSTREKKVFQLMADGLIAKQICGEMGCTRRSIEAVIFRAMKKIDATCQAHAIAICLRHQIIH